MNPNGNDSIPRCAKCSAELKANSLPLVFIMNTPQVSVLSSPHEQSIRCHNCGTHHAYALATYALTWALVECPPPKPKLIEVPSLIAH